MFLTHRQKKQTYGYQKGKSAEEGWIRSLRWKIYTTLYKIDKQQEFTV